METLALFSALALPWLLGIAVLLALDWPRDEMAGSASALRAGFGYMIGAILLTLWMRTLSFAGLAFGWLSIAVPLAAVTAALALYAMRVQRLSIAGARNAPQVVGEPWFAAVAKCLVARDSGVAGDSFRVARRRDRMASAVSVERLGAVGDKGARLVRAGAHGPVCRRDNLACRRSRCLFRRVAK